MTRRGRTGRAVALTLMKDPRSDIPVTVDVDGANYREWFGPVPGRQWDQTVVSRLADPKWLQTMWASRFGIQQDDLSWTLMRVAADGRADPWARRILGDATLDPSTLRFDISPDGTRVAHERIMTFSDELWALDLTLCCRSGTVGAPDSLSRATTSCSHSLVGVRAGAGALLFTRHPEVCHETCLACAMVLLLAGVGIRHNRVACGSSPDPLSPEHREERTRSPHANAARLSSGAVNGTIPAFAGDIVTGLDTLLTGYAGSQDASTLNGGTTDRHRVHQSVLDLRGLIYRPIAAPVAGGLTAARSRSRRSARRPGTIRTRMACTLCSLDAKSARRTGHGMWIPRGGLVF